MVPVRLLTSNPTNPTLPNSDHAPLTLLFFLYNQLPALFPPLALAAFATPPRSCLHTLQKRNSRLRTFLSTPPCFTSPPHILTYNHCSPSQIFISLLHSLACVSKFCRDISHSFNGHYRKTSTSMFVRTVPFTSALLHTFIQFIPPFSTCCFIRHSIACRLVIIVYSQATTFFSIYDLCLSCCGNCTSRRFCLHRTTPHRYHRLKGITTLGSRC